MALYGIGIGAGLAAALLFVATISGSFLALLLLCVAPLPIFIAAMGWNHRAGLVATAVGALALAPFTGLDGASLFALGVGLPAWWLAYLALLGRPDSSGTLEWYPVGRLLVWVAVIAAGLSLASILTSEESFTQTQAMLRRALEGVLAPAPGQPPRSPEEEASARIAVDRAVHAVPGMLSASLTSLLALNLWLGAKVVRVSGRLPREWPFLPGAAMPKTVLMAFAAAIVAGFFSGVIGMAGVAVAGALSVAFMLQGLSFLHIATWGRPARGAILGVTYALILVGQVVMPLVAVLGLADCAFSLRNRFGPGRARPSSPST